jgi:putative heme-binding domain-containing protein
MPDGSGLEVMFGGGFDNPVEVAFTPEGEPLVNVNIVQSVPFRVDAILYGIEGSNYPHADPWRELKRTGEFQPAVGELGWVATSGFTRYRGNSLGEKYAGKYFSTQFNPHRVQMHTVDRDGAGFRVSHADFLACDNPDFHPTDVLEDADGSLLVIDTGGWFRIGCPNSQIAKPDIKGAIYRVNRNDRVDQPSPRTHAAPDERILSTRLVSLNGGPDAERFLLSRLTDSNPAVRREAATGLGRLRARAAVTPLLEAAASVSGDRFLQHAVTYALIRIGDRDETSEGLKHKNPATRRTALIALDQMDGGNLSAEVVMPHLSSDDSPLREAAFEVVAAHPAWAEQVAPTLRAALSRPNLSPADIASIHATLSAFVGAPVVQGVIGDVLDAEATSTPVRLMLLETISGSGISPLPPIWAKPIQRALGHAEEAVVHQAIEAISSSNADAFDAELLAIARDAKRPEPLRIAALGAAMPRAKSLDADEFSMLLGALSSERPPLHRLSAAQAIAAAPLNDVQLKQLAQRLADAGPLELPAIVSAFEQSASSEVGAGLIESLKHAKSLAGLTSTGLSQALSKFSQEIRDSAAPLMQKINPDGAAQKSHLASLQPLLAGGDRNRGQSVFFSKTAACSTCHSVRGIGGHVGPDLTKIASIRAPGDLLESVIYPSLSFARGYESYIVQTKSNQLQSGVLAAETADAIVLRTPTEVRIARSSVKTMRQDRVSIMPQGLEAQMSKQDLSDLLAFLQSLK